MCVHAASTCTSLTWHACKFEHFSFDVACMQCEHSHSYTQVPFLLHCIACAVWIKLKPCPHWAHLHCHIAAAQPILQDAKIFLPWRQQCAAPSVARALLSNWTQDDSIVFNGDIHTKKNAKMQASSGVLCVKMLDIIFRHQDGCVFVWKFLYTKCAEKSMKIGLTLTDQMTESKSLW